MLQKFTFSWGTFHASLTRVEGKDAICFRWQQDGFDDNQCVEQKHDHQFVDGTDPPSDIIMCQFMCTRKQNMFQMQITVGKTVYHWSVQRHAINLFQNPFVWPKEQASHWCPEAPFQLRYDEQGGEKTVDRGFYQGMRTAQMTNHQKDIKRMTASNATYFADNSCVPEMIKTSLIEACTPPMMMISHQSAGKVKCSMIKRFEVYQDDDAILALAKAAHDICGYGFIMTLKTGRSKNDIRRYIYNAWAAETTIVASAESESDVEYESGYDDNDDGSEIAGDNNTITQPAPESTFSPIQNIVSSAVDGSESAGDNNTITQPVPESTFSPPASDSQDESNDNDVQNIVSSAVDGSESAGDNNTITQPVARLNLTLTNV